MSVRDEHKAYDLIAVHAGLAAGLRLPAVADAAGMPDAQRQELAARVADDADARALRDEAWSEFERRLLDSGYTGDQIHAWYEQAYGPIGRSSIYRLRAALRARHSQIAAIAAEAQAYVQAGQTEGFDRLTDAANQRAVQLLFQMLMEARAEQLGGRLNLKGFLGAAKALANLQQASAQSDVLRARLAELQRKLDEQKARADRQAEAVLGESGVDRETINRVRQLYGLPKLEELAA